MTIQNAFWAKVVNECQACHAVGLKPGILDTHYGGYGFRAFVKNRTRYRELPLSPEGLCAACKIDRQSGIGAG